ncbi:MAG: aminotransferase class I/II-fold pyridoxal phosphate-dependent enzyme [Solirubrobacterales bacterium]
MPGSTKSNAPEIQGATAREIAESVESLIERGELRPGAVLPSVRSLGSQLGVSPMTVVAAYRELRQRGIVNTHERRRTRVSSRPPIASRAALPLGNDLRDLASDNPDPAFIPELTPFLAKIPPEVHLYGEKPILPALRELATARFEDCGVRPDALTVVSGTFDAIERILQNHLKQGDAVAVEDPGYTGVLDLVRALGLQPVGMLCDEFGPLPEELDRVLRAGARACVITPRAQNPLGAALDAERGRALAACLRGHPEVWVIEDDHAGPITDLPYVTLTEGRDRWAVIQSVSKSIGPDLRVAVVGGDVRTISQLEGRQLLANGWVSFILQQTVVALWRSAEVEELVADAAAAYSARREAVKTELAKRGIESFGRSGLNVWVPVNEEGTVLRNLMQLGWAATAGEVFRISSDPGLRVTTAGLPEAEAPQLAEDISLAINPGFTTTSR